MFHRVRLIGGALVAALSLVFVSTPSQAQTITANTIQRGSLERFNFDMVRSASAEKANCIPKGRAVVAVKPVTGGNRMVVDVYNMPPRTAFSLFILQTPNAPFGVGWYQGDMDTDAYGHGRLVVQGIFNEETFSLSLAGPANGSDPKQDVAGKAVVDTNVTFRPTSQFHLGLWFSDPAEAAKAGCTDAVTPFDGDQEAGIQALSTRNFADNLGPLAAIKP